jgi:hypothetical protein
MSTHIKMLSIQLAAAAAKFLALFCLAPDGMALQMLRKFSFYCSECLHFLAVYPIYVDKYI